MGKKVAQVAKMWHAMMRKAKAVRSSQGLLAHLSCGVPRVGPLR